MLSSNNPSVQLIHSVNSEEKLSNLIAMESVNDQKDNGELETVSSQKSAAHIESDERDNEKIDLSMSSVEDGKRRER